MHFSQSCEFNNTEKYHKKETKSSKGFIRPAGVVALSKNRMVAISNWSITGIAENKIAFYLLSNALFFKSQSKDIHKIRMWKGAAIIG